MQLQTHRALCFCVKPCPGIQRENASFRLEELNSKAEGALMAGTVSCVKSLSS